MAAGAAIPGLFFSFAAMVLLIFASISAPTWNKISFLHATRGGQAIDFGIFGNSVTAGHHLGWNFPANALGYNPGNLNSGVVHNLTYTMILVPIAGGLAALATLFGLIGATYHRIGTVMMTLTAALGTLTALVAWVLAMVLFGGYAKTSLRHNGWDASYHNAMWLVLAAWFSLALAFCSGAIGSFGRYRRRRTEYPATY